MTAPIDLDALDAALARRAPGGWREMDGDVPGDARAIVAAIAAAPQLVALARAVVAYASAYSQWDEAERRAACASERKYQKALDEAMEANATAQKARAALLTLAAGFTTTRDRASGEG
jgi:hypothetical protein